MVTVASDGFVDIHTHWGQTAALESKARMVFMISGTQGGKTVLGPPWLYNEIKEKGAGDYLAVTANFGLFQLKMLPAMRDYFEKIMHIGKYWAGLGVLEIAHPKKGFLAKTQNDEMWARILLRSVASPSGLESATAKGAWLDECGMPEFKYEGWEAVQRRLSIHQGRVLGTTTPYNLGWLKTFVYDRWVANDPTYDVIQFSSTVNPAFPDEEFQRAKDTLPEWRFNMFYRGLFEKPFGLIYKDYDDVEMLSKIDLDDLPTYWPMIVGVDFGGANTATVYLVEDTSKDPSVFHVIYDHLEGGMSTDDHVNKAIKRIAGRTHYRVVGGSPSETQNRMDWRKAGLKIEQPPFSDVEVGISNVIELFRTKRLRIHQTCGGIRHELATYSRVATPEGDILNDIQDKNDYHRLDGLRYACSIVKTWTGTVGAFGRR